MQTREMNVQVGQTVRIEDAAPLNGAVGTVVALVSDVERPYAVVAVYGAEYRISDLDLVVIAEAE